MVKQQRALRTRGALLRAAAEVFDEQGYGGASFTQICKRVGISMGALTYHFSTKDDLVAAIRAEGRAATASTVERVVSGALPPLCAAVELTLAVTDLLAADAAVRATARLSRERPALEPAWASLWAEPLGDLIRRAGAGRGLRAGVDPDTVTALAFHLVTGAETVLCHDRHHHGTAPDGSTTRELARIWQLILPGIAAVPCVQHAPHNGGTPLARRSENLS
ncbi:TetR/AcrR family transcriptional regulator [Streptomyces sp. NPDC002589]|uniref:TetR/AcrR family transcriptional regulator n=1 Tax=unclassified Streptomyces TaxID=2593676 RepID=UPI00331D1201